MQKYLNASVKIGGGRDCRVGLCPSRNDTESGRDCHVGLCPSRNDTNG